MARFIVTTTASAPTKALLAFAAIPGWRLIVVGDMKTPHDEYQLNGVTYLSPGRQVEIDRTLSDLIGWNCVQRRNMGYVYAMQHGAEMIATVDDDNVPTERWGRDVWAGGTAHAMVYGTGGTPAFDPLSVTNNFLMWHRGYPLQWLSRRHPVPMSWLDVRCDVQANLWDGAPDIDAVCRMMFPHSVKFSREAMPYTSDMPAPFNSQNTILSRAAMRDYFCFPGVGRFDDIYASYVCQAHGHRVVFGEPTVVQERNAHDATADMRAEFHGYEHCAELVTALARDRGAWRGILPSQSADAFDRYRELVH